MMKKRVVRAGLLLVLLLGFILPVIAGEYTVFGPQRYERGAGKPATVTSTFTSPVVGADFTLRLSSGDDQGRNRVSSGAMALNGAAILGPVDFNQQVQKIERVVPLSAQNSLSLQLASAPGSYLTVSVVGVDNIPPQLTISAPLDNTITEAATVDVLGTVSDATPVTISVNGNPAVVSADTFHGADIPLQLGTNTILVTATDLGGNSGSTSVTVTRKVLRPSVEPQPEGTFGAQYQDLIPADSKKTSYDPKRFSLITGEVKGLDNQPISGVTVSVGAGSCVECHGQEYGTVRTNAEGRFTLPVEGGATMTVTYQKPGQIPSHRQVYVPWNGYAVAETIQMLVEDTAATTIAFDGNPATVMTHRSTPVTDSFGERSATLVFTGDNQAYEVDAGGNVIRELNSITTRATEFVTPESMPANLPPTSAYTYCAEFSVDGVQRVKFAKPVIGWVDNFLGFDVGEIVPVGYYDRDRGVWVPSDNGRVVMLLDTDGDGVVDALDSDGDNFPDDLNGDGSFRDEVKGLEDPARYHAGASFWRFSVTHFTPWDCNWPYGPPPDAIPPNPVGEPEVDQQASEKENPCDKSEINSFVEDRSRIFHEDIPIPGTDMTLHYASNRASGYGAQIVVPASGATIPPSLKRIVVRVQIAGRLFVRNLSPLPYQRGEFTWDGLDALGSPMSGSVMANIEIGFVYDAVYYSPGDFSKAFANAGSDVTGVPARMEVISWRRAERFVDIGTGLFAGGWSLSDHHYLSPAGPKTLFKGDGQKISANSAVIISAFAGGGSQGDGGPAVQAFFWHPGPLAVDAAGNLYISDSYADRVRKVDTAGIITTVMNGLDYPLGVAVDVAGNLYVADYFNNRIRKLDVNGTSTTVAGNGDASYTGIVDDVSALQSAVISPTGVAVDTVGNLYILEQWGSNRIRKVDSSGIITTIAGGGNSDADNIPAIKARLNSPNSIVVDAGGNLYFTEDNYYIHRVRKVDATGIITTIAGSSRGYTGDGGPAILAKLSSPSGIALDVAGNLFIADSGNNRVRMVNSAGIITTIAGNGLSGFSGENGTATQAALGASGLAIDPAGILYISDFNLARVRRVGPIASFIKAGMTADDMFSTEESGLGHIISSAGLHKKIIDLNTSATLRTFGYDANGNLITITDRFGKVTTINRDLNGVPTAIISPDGQLTQLTIDVADQLTAITYPDGEYYSFEYTPDGLLTAEVDPNGNRFEHAFDSSGRLTDVTDPESGHWNYSRAYLPNGAIQVQKTTGEGNTTTYLDRTDSTGAYTTTITGPNGANTIFSRSADSLTETSASSCGMSQVRKYGLDTEYKTQFVKEQTESTPAGKKRLTLRDKTYLDTNGDKIPDKITDKVTVNGKITTLLQDVLLAKKEATSPVGRKVTSFYDTANLLTQRLAVSGLFDVTYAYDASGRPTSIGQGERQTAFVYNDQGFLASVTDPEQRTTSYDTDVMGRVTEIHRPDLSSIGFEYDNNGNMTVLENPSSVAHGFDYNGNDYKTGYQTPQSGSYRYTYDKDRRLTETLFPSGRSLVNLYDKDRLAKVVTPEGDITLNYLCATKLGSMSKGGETLTYTYDGKLVTSEKATGTLAQTLSYTYNNDFNVSAMTYAAGTVNYVYDNDGLLTGSGSFTISRDAANGLPKTVSGGTYSLSRSFSGYGEVTAETTTIGGINRFAYSLSRSPAGRINAKTETVGGTALNYAYSYDELGRLTGVTKDNAIVEEYRYDNVGRRSYEMNVARGIDVRSLTYSDEDHLLTAGDTAYQYDLDGFLTSKTDASGATAYSYSSRGELLKVVLPASRIVEFVHDPQGRRIAKKVNGAITEKYLWQGLTRLLAVYNGSNALVMRFQYADGRMPVSLTKGSTTYNLGYDQVGSLRLITDSTGNTAKQVEYDSFGNILTDSNPTFTVPFGFAGGLHDRDINLVRFGFRDYDPETGRWTAKDPIGFAGGDVDLFNYVSNPINLIDPYGLSAWSNFWSGVGERMQAAKPAMEARTQEMAGQVASAIKADTIPTRLLSPYGWTDIVIDVNNILKDEEAEKNTCGGN